MPVNTEAYKTIKHSLEARHVTLVAVSKFKTPEDIMTLYELGQRDFGENFVQELLMKEAALPKDIRWHFIGHLQTNKVKYLAPFIHMIHGADSEKLLSEINKQGAKIDRTIRVLLQMFIADEATKFGFDADQVTDLPEPGNYPFILFEGMMGMASFTDDTKKVAAEFSGLRSAYKKFTAKYPGFNTLSMGMSGDYEIAVAAGTTMVRIGSLLFGSR